jgi:hypothetical protein
MGGAVRLRPGRPTAMFMIVWFPGRVACTAPDSREGP